MPFKLRRAVRRVLFVVKTMRSAALQEAVAMRLKSLLAVWKVSIVVRKVPIVVKISRNAARAGNVAKLLNRPLAHQIPLHKLHNLNL
ncbi:MAG: hypothetical protein CMJ77_06550 [Planctomycetaceae bacterium]|nr:hypothetical protein [Planctomycetaceae bacterium]